jgi:hypothetical protein
MAVGPVTPATYGAPRQRPLGPFIQPLPYQSHLFSSQFLQKERHRIIFSY